MLVQLTHLTDFSYLDRLTMEVPALLFALHCAWSADKFASLHPKKLIKFRLQTVVMYLIIVSLSLFVAYDSIVTHIKYEEGFYCNPATLEGSLMPSSLFSARNQDLVTSADAIINVVYTTKNSSLFLLIALFSKIAHKELRSQSFMSSTEFRLYKVWGFLSIAAYPILQTVMDRTSRALYATVYPQIFYSFEVLMICTLAQLTVYRLGKLRKGLPAGSSTAYRLGHYSRMLHSVTALGLLDFIGLFAINVDVLNVDNRVIYKNKLATDICTKLHSYGIVLVFIPAVLCVYPGERLSVRGQGNTTAVASSSPRASVLSSKAGPSSAANSPRVNRACKFASSAGTNSKAAGATSVQMIAVHSPHDAGLTGVVAQH